MKDYYKILNCEFNDSSRKIYKCFKKLIIEFTNQYDSFKNNHFQLLNEAYFILSNRTYKKSYNTQYRNIILKDTSVKLKTEELETLDIYIKRAQAKAYEVSIIPFDEYSEKFLKRPSLLSIIMDFILSVGS